MENKLQRVPLDVSIHWRYLHQDAGKTYSEISKMRSYWKYSKATICRHMKKNIGHLVVDLRKINQGRPPKLSVRQKRNILRQTKLLQEEMGNFCVKRVMVKAGIPPSISEETVWRVLRKAGLKWARVQRKGILTKNDLKLRLKFARKVRRKLPANSWEEGVGFYLDEASFTHKMNPFDQARAPSAMAWRKVKARSAWDEVGARKFTIPARSPDLNPMENIFHIVKRRLRQDALDQQITREDFPAFSARVKTILETIPIDVVDRTILSMGKRINKITKRKGQRIKY